MKAVYFVATALVGVVMFWVGFQLRPVIEPWEQQEVAAMPRDESMEVQQTEQSAAELAAQGYLTLEELTVRIDDGDVQWFDGTMWHTVASMEELVKEDKFYVAQEGFQEFEEQLKQQQAERRAEQESPTERGETLLVGQKETPKPVDKPKPTKPAATAPAEGSVSAPGTPSESGGNGGGSNPGGGNNGNSGGGNPGGGNSGNSGGGNPGGGDSGTSSGGNSGGNSGEVNPGGDNNPGSDSGNTGDGGSAGDSGNAGSGDSGGDTGDGENMEWSDDYL